MESKHAYYNNVPTLYYLFDIKKGRSGRKYLRFSEKFRPRKNEK